MWLTYTVHVCILCVFDVAKIGVHVCIMWLTSVQYIIQCIINCVYVANIGVHMCITTRLCVVNI